MVIPQVDVTVKGNVMSGSQQQFFFRNSEIGGDPNGGVIGKVFVGCKGAPGLKCNTGSGAGNKIVVPSTPMIAEKPYIAIKNDKYFLVVPNVE